MKDAFLKKNDMEEEISEDNINIPQWQIDKVKKAVKYAEENLQPLWIGNKLNRISSVVNISSSLKL